jgi:hypothetical protein
MKPILCRSLVMGLTVACLLLAPAPGQASDGALTVYEDWSGQSIRSDRWSGGEVSGGQEVSRELAATTDANYLTMRLRRDGETDSNTGLSTSVNFLNFTKPAPIDEIEADLGVLDVLVNGCPANNAPSEARLVITMTSFNDGSSTGSSDRTGDYVALIQAFRRSDSADPAGIFRVEAQITRCQDASCSTGQQIVPPTDLGVRVPVLTLFTMRLIWDGPNNRFLAGVNLNPNVALPYRASDGLAAVGPSAGIQISNSTAKCTAVPTVADLAVGVGQVRTNSSPPPSQSPSPPPFFLQPPPPPPSQPPFLQPPPPSQPSPPPVTQPAPPPPGDNSPFVFPPQPNIAPITDGSTRYLGLGSDPQTGWPCYAGLQFMPNPAPALYLYAGNRPDGLTDGTAGMRVWVPSGAQPAAIRFLLQGGKLPFSTFGP